MLLGLKGTNPDGTASEASAAPKQVSSSFR